MSTTLQTINVHELKNQLAANPNLCLIDVRELDEWQEMHIPCAIHIPKDALATTINQYVLDKDTPVYLHCRSGVRSLHAAQSLLELGYCNVYSVEGGIIEWAMFGYPIKQ